MPNSFEVFRKTLEAHLGQHGSKSEFCRKSGIQRSALERWLSGQGEASLSSLDKAAGALDQDPWDLIRPLGAPPIPSGFRADLLPALLEIATLLPALDKDQIAGLLFHAQTEAAKANKNTPQANERAKKSR